MTSEHRVLRLASITAFLLGAFLVALGIYEYATGGRPASSITAGVGAIVVAGICYQIANRGRVKKDRPV